jgi:hypothetical protein
MFDNYYEVKTDAIHARIRPTDGQHIYFDANANSGHGKFDPIAHYMEIRGVVYGISAHLYQWKDGEWYLGDEDGKNGQALYISRTDHKDPSEAAKRTAHEMITDIVRKWTKENPAALKEAQEAHIAAQLEKKRGELAGKRKALADLEAEIEALEKELDPPEAHHIGTAKGLGAWGICVPCELCEALSNIGQKCHRHEDLNCAVCRGEKTICGECHMCTTCHEHAHDCSRVTRLVCPKCSDRHPAEQGIILYTRQFVCPNDNETWSDVWCSNCNDKCPKCGAEIEPSETTEETIEAPRD